MATVLATISIAICSKVKFTSGLAFPAILVPSTDTTPDSTNPAFSHSFNTSANNFASACW